MFQPPGLDGAGERGPGGAAGRLIVQHVISAQAAIDLLHRQPRFSPWQRRALTVFTPAL